MTFDDLNLNKPLLNALADMGITHPTTIQHKAFSVAMSGRDLVGIAQTGTGKTYAYLLPCLRQWKFSKDRFPQILIVVPTRELVLQVVEEAKKLTAYQNVIVAGVFGGVNIKRHANVVIDGLDVLVATPGRLLDLVLSGALKLKSIKRFVIDEVDEMLNLGFHSQLTRLLDLLPEKRQNLMFSATLTEEVASIISTHFNDPENIEAAPTGTPLKNICQLGYEVPNFNTKTHLLQHLVQTDRSMTKVLVFASTKRLADVLFEKMDLLFPGQFGVIHSNKAQNNRFHTVNAFHEGKIQFLISTDIMARGLDIAGVSHVVNFDTPDVPENYMHRVGRTGRADAEGIAITFVADRETQYRDRIETLMKTGISWLELPEEVDVSEILTPDEMPRVAMPYLQVKTPSVKESGPAFQEKKAKNKKENSKQSHKAKMRVKYKKPKTRGQKGQKNKRR